MNTDHVQALVNNSQESIEIAKNISDTIVSEYTSVLDEIMKDIKTYIIDAQNAPSSILEKYFLELTSAYYFIAPKCEMLGLQGDMTNSDAKLKFNEVYNELKMRDTLATKKPTVAELTASAEIESIDEQLVADIYSRSYKMVKIKLDAADTMISTLSKIITTHDNERKLTGVVDI